MTVRVAFALQRAGTAAQPGPQPPAPTPTPTPTTQTTSQLSPQAQREWDTAWQNVSKLAVEQKFTEAIALMEAFIRRNPNMADAHYLASSMYEQRAALSVDPAAQRRDLESVVT